jgi:hypothetical protein
LDQSPRRTGNKNKISFYYTLIDTFSTYIAIRTSICGISTTGLLVSNCHGKKLATKIISYIVFLKIMCHTIVHLSLSLATRTRSCKSPRRVTHSSCYSTSTSIFVPRM